MALTLTQYQIDAFAQRAFEGNPAAVCPLERWLDDALLQAIAAENNLSETAYFVASGKKFRLRWFTPVAEVDLCGHATLASAFVLFEILGYDSNSITFETRSGDLIVTRRGDLLAMDFPARPAQPCEPPPALIGGLGAAPASLLAADDYIAVFEHEDQIRALQPDHGELRKLELRGVAVTAPGREFDFVSRFLRAEVRHSGGSGDRLAALRAGALLGGTARQEHPRRATSLHARGHRTLRARGRARDPVRAGGEVHGSADRDCGVTCVVYRR